MMSQDERARMIAAMNQVITTIEITGGVLRYPDGTHAPAADHDWIDLGEAYLEACKAIGKEPMVTDAPSESGHGNYPAPFTHGD